MRTAKIMLFVALGFGIGCKSKSKLDGESYTESSSTRSRSPEEPPREEDKPDDGNESGGIGTAMALDEGKMGKKESERAEGQYKMQKTAPAAPGFFGGEVRDATIAHGNGTGNGYGVGGGRGGMRGKDAEPKKPAKNDKSDEKAPEAATRAWFPETFLWTPLVVTDAKGAATVPVRVPDRLTSWHVLALAHSRSGAQGGATASFLGTLPTYVDVVVPPFMIVGDTIRLPIQVVNTTEAAISSALTVEVVNATLGPIGGARTIPAAGSLVEYATLTANKAGQIKLKATIGSSDAVVRTIDVLPAGKPAITNRSGTLAAPRTLSIEGPVGADPATDRARLVVYPGALALLRSELGVSTARSGVADDAYALLLAGRASALLAALGDKADPDAIRNLSLITGQKMMRDARNLDVDSAMLITEAALSHGQNPVMTRLGERASAFLAKNQRPDGSFGGGNGWTLQRVLVATADGARAVAADVGSTAAKQRGQAVVTRASGMVERNFERITDGYTAAAILASGAVKGELATKLRAKVIESIKASDDGARYLDVPAGVVRTDGTVPSRAEATAFAVLGLDGDPKAPLADLGATLIGSYSPIRGWGDGRANLVAMRAVLQLFKDPVPADVAITLFMDGKEITSGRLDRAALRDVLALEAAAPGVAGKHEWKIVAEPAVPGLGYALILNSWVPWVKETTTQGLELALPAIVNGSVGKPSELAITAIAPAGFSIHITEALPAGVQIDTPSVEKLVTAGVIERFETSDGKLELFVPPLAVGAVFTAKYKVIPTLAGTLHAAASKIEQGNFAFHVQPTEWNIKP